ncbi:GDSL esterase/lipase At5g55050-like [Prunus avium]|uniref:GDSL esterase/lipase At5g55050-like n=1 Tax=Prunus avium TaxID=42229 RepID=A0A6P5RE96_PRUAV|nr:GDSL esterase/lipase At5g55050-like [Prunus avium]
MTMAPSNVFPITFFFFFTFFSVFISLSKAQMVPAIYVFGDSLADVGNNNYLKISLVKADFPHNGVDFPNKKATGRFGNGRNSADFLAEKVGLPTSPPYLSLVSKSNKQNFSFVAGVSFASGGAGIFNGSDEKFQQSIPLSYQVNYYSQVYEDIGLELGSNGAQDHLSKSLFLIVIGSNDIFGYFDSSKLRKESTPDQYVDSMVSNLKQQLERINSLGARKFVVVGTAPVGCCPAQRISNDGECNEDVNSMSIRYNDGLKSMLQQSEAALHIKYTFFETYGVFSDLIQNGSSYGFTETEAACCGFGKLNADSFCLPISSLCPNRTDHVFWDKFHPTEATHSILVDKLFDGPSQYTFPTNVKELIAL